MSGVTAFLAIHHLLRVWRQTLALAFMFAFSVALALVTTGYQAGLTQEFGGGRGIAAPLLVVQEPGTIGEIGGSRLPPEVRDRLAAWFSQEENTGAGEIIPQVYRAVGVSIQEVIQMRGVDLANYPKTVSFEMLDGAPLDADSATRVAMLGWRLADRLDVNVGGTVDLRGRSFQVVGVFKTGTYADNEAWVALADAQMLLGWGDDVSIYFIPEDGPLRPGTFPAPDLEVVRRGEATTGLTASILPLMDYLQQVSRASLLACGLTLAVILLRLAWLHRRELAILNCLGFPPKIFGIYLTVQALVIAITGSLFGLIFTWLAGQSASIQAAGYDIPMVFLPEPVAQLAAWLTAITLAGIALPALWLYRMAPDDVLRVA